MTYRELYTRTLALLDLGGYANAVPPPDPRESVNAAYREFVWETECNFVIDASLTTVADQAEYTLPTPEWRAIEGVYVNGLPIEKISPFALFRDDPMWDTYASATPLNYWRVRSEAIRLYPIPSASSLVIKIYGLRLFDDLSADTDTPKIPKVYHTQIAQRAYWIEAEKWARGEERTMLMDQIQQYMDKLHQYKSEFRGNRLLGAQRSVRPNAVGIVRV